MPKVFGVDYKFLACGDVFTQGLVHAAEALGIEYQHAAWDDPRLPAQLQRFQPDLLFVVHGRKFTARHRALLKSYRSAVWLLDEPYEVDDTAEFSKPYDQVFVNDPATLARHHAVTYLPVCYDPQIHQPGAGTRHRAVGFIGGGNQTRERYLSALAEQGLLTYLVGGPWTDRRVRALCFSNNIPAAQTPLWYQSTRIVLNVFRERHHYNRHRISATSLNPRVYEALACGALVVSEWRSEIDSLVPELPVFRSIQECVSLVRELLADQATANGIQMQCAERLAPHTYAARLQTVLTTMGCEVAA